jgi:pyrroline-5-carboxylate reductase
METYNLKILFIGYGNMGRAIADSFAKSSDVKELVVIDPNYDEKITKNISIYNNVESLKDFKADILLFAVKPQLIAKIASGYKEYISESTIIFSIAAGVNINFFQNLFPNQDVIRLMPNLAAMNNKSVNFLFCSNKNHKNLADNLCSPFGKNIWLDSENQFHDATAASGSGPAYYFLFLEIFTEFLKEKGFEEEQAKNIAWQTADGAVSLAGKSQNFKELKEQVTSKGGTTAAGREVFEKDDALKKLFIKALDHASVRSKELSDA